MTPERAPALIIKPLIVLLEVGAVIAPLVRNVPVFVVDPMIVVLPAESTLKYFMDPALFVTLKISTEPKLA